MAGSAPPSGGEQQRLGHRPDRHADDDLVGELGQLPRPVRPDMDRTTHRAQDRLDLGEVGTLAARHDGERAGLGTHRAAGDRGVHMGDAALGQPARVILRLGRLDRAHVDDDRPGPQRLSDAGPEQDLLDHRAVLQHQHHDLGLADRLGCRIDDPGTVGHELLGSGAGAVPGGQRIASAQQVAGLVQPHQPCAEEGDGGASGHVGWSHGRR